MYQTLSESIYVSMNRIWCYFQIQEVLRETPSSKTILSGKIHGSCWQFLIWLLVDTSPQNVCAICEEEKKAQENVKDNFVTCRGKPLKNKEEDDSDGGNQQEEIDVIAGRQHFLRRWYKYDLIVNYKHHKICQRKITRTKKTTPPIPQKKII